MYKVILPLAALIAFTACSKDEDDTAAAETEEAAAEEEADAE
jgi:hypothetical protein